MATATSRDIENQLNSMTECVICTDTYNDPRVLPCVHTYCLKCIRRVCDDKQPRDEVPCPLCRKVFKIPNDGVDGLPKNFLVEQLKDFADTSGEHCEICSDEMRSEGKTCATHFCVECGQRMCEACVNNHRRIRLTSSHKVVVVDDFDDSTVRLLAKTMVSQYCDNHRTEVLKFYCFDCKEVICVTCFVEKHSAHKCSDVNKVADEFRTQVKNDIGRMVDTVTKCRDHIRQQKQNKIEFGNKVAKVEREICDRAERLKKMIDAEKTSLLQEVVSLKKDGMERIDHVIDEIEQHVTLTESLVQYAEELIQKGTAGDVTQQTSSVQRRVGELLKLDSIQKAIFETDSIIGITFTSAISLTKSSERLIGRVHRQAHEFKSPTLRYIIPQARGMKRVVGITSLNDQLFVLRDPCEQQVEVYSTSTFKLQRKVKLDGLRDAYCIGLTSCVTNHCIYVGNFKADSIFRVDLIAGDEILKWGVKSPRGLSINSASNVLVTCRDCTVFEFTTRGSLVRNISLSSLVSNPWYAIQLTDGHFVVSHWVPVKGVSIVDSRGQFVQSYRNNQSKSIHLPKTPVHLAADKKDFIFVVDSANDRILVLNSSLSCARVLSLPVDGGLTDPWCLHYDEASGRIFVGEDKGGRILAFDNVVNMCALFKTV